jgi:hypothetical protein
MIQVERVVNIVKQSAAQQVRHTPINTCSCACGGRHGDGYMQTRLGRQSRAGKEKAYTCAYTDNIER